mgnify:CR=1 FL=1
MFITLEGIDGCGKSTQAALLVEGLRRRFCPAPPPEGMSVLWTKEPGGWTGGDSIRSLILEGNLLHPLSELFLFLADRCEHVRQVVGPALEQGRIVVCERYTDSTLAYQSWGRGIPPEKVERLFQWCAFPVPDVTFWIDVPPEKALRRLRKRGHPDRLEAEGAEFLERVRSGFSSLALGSGGRILTIDGDRDADVISLEIAGAVERFLSR